MTFGGGLAVRDATRATAGTAISSRRRTALDERANGPLTFTFSQSLTGIGANIQADFFGAFTAQLCDSNNVCVTEDGNSNSNGDGSAIFIGLTDPNGFTSATFSLTACSNDCANFAINQMDIIPGGSGVPEPGTLALLGSGLMGAVAYGRRRLGL